MSRKIQLQEIRDMFHKAGVEWKEEYSDEFLAANRSALVKNYETKSNKSIPILMDEKSNYSSATPSTAPSRIQQRMSPGISGGDI